ncbi:MAG TPA: glycosyltransferase [Candidatus Acidoferrales bacterium]|nr:glycosyltransferase [Candidatus Acidoferrales bacterium]
MVGPFQAMIFIVSPSAHYPSHNWPNTLALTRALIRKGRQVRIVIFSSTTDAIPTDLQGQVTAVFSHPPSAWRQVAAGRWQNRRFGGLMSLCETWTCLFRALRLSRNQPDAVLHFIGGSYWMVVVATLLFRRRFVYSLYGGILSGPATGAKAMVRKFSKWVLRRAAGTNRLDFTCENEFLRDEIAAHIGTHVRVIPYAIDDEERPASQVEARRRLGLPLTEKILLFYGTHRREKDYLTPLKGCLTLPTPPLALFVGKLISDNDPSQVVAACRYPNAKVVNEFVPEEMTKYYFAAADALVLPYEANFARGSGVLIECCHHFRPMIASAAPYFSAFLARYPCGVTYAPADSASFAAAAQHLLADTTVFRDALERARHDHSWNAAAGQYLELYESGKRPAGLPARAVT